MNSIQQDREQNARIEAALSALLVRCGSPTAVADLLWEMEKSLREAQTASVQQHLSNGLTQAAGGIIHG